MKQNELLIIHGEHIIEMTRSLLEEAGLEAMIGDRETAVRIKPNLMGPVTAEEGGTTHAEVVEGLILYLQEHGFRNISVCEGSWAGDLTADAVSLCGYDRLCDRYGVPFRDMQKEPGVKTDCDGLELNLCAAALEPGFLINVPVLKGHCQTKITCALKNLKGLLPNTEKRRFHRMGLHDPIAHLNARLHQDFILIDSICGDLTSEDGGHPVAQNRLVAGCDPVLCDAYGCRILGIGTEEVGYITSAEALGIGSTDLEQAQIRMAEEGGAFEPVCADSIKPCTDIAMRLTAMQEVVQEVDSCSFCYAQLMPVLERLNEEGLLEKLSEQICIGQGYRGKSGNLGVGSCTAGFTHTLKGCPPDPEEMYSFLRDYIQNNYGNM